VLIVPNSDSDSAFKEGIPIEKVLDLRATGVFGRTFGAAIAAPKSTPPPKPA
jgi:hypothetical protein